MKFIKTRDSLQGQKRPSKMNQNDYRLAVLVWIANLIALPGSLLFMQNNTALGICFIVLFVGLLINGFNSGTLSHDGRSQPIPKEERRFFDRCLPVLYALFLLAAVVCFGMLLISGGGPDIVDGQYCVTSHGDLVKMISKQYYLFLSVCEALLFSVGLLFFNTYMLIQVRAKYFHQHNALPTFGRKTVGK